MLRAALFKTEKERQEEIKCSLMGKLLNKLWLMHTVKCSASIRKIHTHIYRDTHTHTHDVHFMLLNKKASCRILYKV